MSVSQTNIVHIPVRDLLQLDQVHRNANSLGQFLQNCNVRERTWNSAIQILRTWTEIQEVVSEYVLYGDQEATSDRVLIKLRTLLVSTGKLVFFNGFDDLSITDLLCEVHLNFDNLLYRYQGFDQPITCMIPLSTQPSPNEFESVINRINETERRADIVMVLALGNADNIRYIHNSYSDYKIILIDEYDLKTLVFADEIRTSFNRIVVRDIDRRDIQPYSHTGIRPSMFYGREREIGSILGNQSKSYAIFGPRRIGKTFLVKEIERRIAVKPEYRVVYFSCEKKKSHQVKDRLLREVGIKINRETRRNFEDHLRTHIKRSHKKFVFMLDEVDDLIAEEKKRENEFFASLRNLHNELQENCRFVFIGFQTLVSQLDHWTSPFYNFTERLLLDCLTEDATRKLILQPMESELFLTFHNKGKLVEEILQKTMRHPALIQFMCAKVIERACEEGRTTISPDDVQEVFNLYEYRKLIIGSFWNVLERMQQIFALQMLQIMRPVTSIELQDALTENGVHLDIGDVEFHLEGMIVAGMIVKKSQFYSFANSLFSDILRQSEDTVSLFERLRRELHASFTESRRHIVPFTSQTA
ncbi:ATP-binding protein [Desulfobacterales bacterium HSG2]|nr:ATP-binding protein [Desulfobacterales bacterium HSG2]